MNDQIVTYEIYCANYDLEIDSEGSKLDYQKYCNNLQLKKSERGGARPNSGRKSRTSTSETKAIRIPSNYEETVRALIQHLEGTRHINKYYPPETSNPVFLRSLHTRDGERKGDNPQMITFTTESVSAKD